MGQSESGSREVHANRFHFLLPSENLLARPVDTPCRASFEELLTFQRRRWLHGS